MDQEKELKDVAFLKRKDANDLLKKLLKEKNEKCKIGGGETKSRVTS